MAIPFNPSLSQKNKKNYPKIPKVPKDRAFNFLGSKGIQESSFFLFWREKNSKNIEKRVKENDLNWRQFFMRLSSYWTESRWDWVYPHPDFLHSQAFL